MASKLYQDNTDTMLLDENGKASIRKITRNINIWYFFVKNRVNALDLVIDNFPSENMWGTYSPSHCRGENSEGLGI